MLNLKAEKYQDVSLKLILAIMNTKKSTVILSEAIKIAQKMNDKTLVTALENVGLYLESGETSMLEAFYQCGILTDDVFYALKPVQERDALDAETINEAITDINDRKSMFKKMRATISQPLMVIGFTSLIAVYILLKFIPLMESAFVKGSLMEPSYYPYYYWMAEHAYLTSLMSLTLFLSITIAIIAFLFTKTGKTEIKMYNVASVISALRLMKVSYPEIFSTLYESEKNRTFKHIFLRMHEDSKELSVSDYIDPLLTFIPIEIAVALITRVQSGDDYIGWRDLKKEMKETVYNKIEMISGQLPTVVYALLAVILGLTALPIVPAMQELMSKG